jgi:SnoaL-like domain
MAEPSLRTRFETFLAAVNNRDTTALDAVLHPDYEETYPQSGERTRGLVNLKAIIENYPGGYTDLGMNRVVGGEDRWVATPHFTLLRIEGTGSVFTGLQKGRYPDGSDWYIVSIAEFKDGLVWRAQTFFAPTFEAPSWRSQWVDVPVQ